MAEGSASRRRAVFCNRTLNMRTVQAIGFDMDYTLVHYHFAQWEQRAFAHARQRLAEQGWPVDQLTFDQEQFSRGLILDLQLGNIVKANRFGYVTRAAHGTRMLAHDEQRRIYSQVWIDLADSTRWVFLNTLFSLSEACLFGQLVELRDRGTLGADLEYAELYKRIGRALDAAHLEGELKAEVIADPERFVAIDDELPQTLLDLRQAGKKLFVATNSEWNYTDAMMRHVLGRFLPGGDWRSLWDLVIVQARKPSFFDGNAPFHAIRGAHGAVDEQPSPLRAGGCFRGGNAQLVQEHLQLGGGEILYVGDHVYADVHVSSQIRRWRTALILRELEDEVAAEEQFAAAQRELQAAIDHKDVLDREQATLRLALQRLQHGEPTPAGVALGVTAIQERLRALRPDAEALELRIGDLARAAGQLGNARWGPLLRAGGDKSRLARQIESHADVYTSRVSNLLALTPFGYLRAARGSLPHDPR